MQWWLAQLSNCIPPFLICLQLFAFLIKVVTIIHMCSFNNEIPLRGYLHIPVVVYKATSPLIPDTARFHESVELCTVVWTSYLDHMYGYTQSNAPKRTGRNLKEAISYFIIRTRIYWLDLDYLCSFLLNFPRKPCSCFQRECLVQ